MVKIFNNSTKATVGSVVEKPATGQYLIEDSKGRKYKATSFDTYAVGQSVLLLDGYIIGKAGTKAKPQIFKV